MDISAIAGAFDSVKAVKSLSTTAIDLRDEAKLRDHLTESSLRLGEVVDKLMAAQLAQSDLIQMKSDLEKRLRELEDLHQEAEKYELQITAAGTFALARKPNVEPVQPPHYICQRCWNVDKKKSILQPGANTTLHCAECKTAIVTQPRQPAKGPVRSPFGSEEWQTRG